MAIPAATARKLKLNIGAGKRRLPGYVGIDAVERPAADIVAFAHEIPLADGCAIEVLAIHLVEHVHLWELPPILKEWARLLEPGGRLVLELPDLIKCCANVLAGRSVPNKHPHQIGMFGLYGDTQQCDPFMAHKWAYTFKTLAPIVEAAGFRDIVERATVFHPVGRDRRDFRLEATKA